MDMPRLIMLCGAPGSGKSTYAANYVAKHSNTVILSSDSIRKQLYGAEEIQGNPNEVFCTMQMRAVECFNNGEDVIYDATNITRKDRSGIISQCPKFTHIECYVIWAPIEVCIERDAARERTVGKEVIDKMLKRFQAPFFNEGFDEIKIIKPVGFNEQQYGLEQWDAMRISHDNPYHSNSIDQHCDEAYHFICDNMRPIDVEVWMASLWHDMGKPYCKSFINTKGETTDVAHFYQHQCVGAWEIYGIEDCTPYVAWLVSTHMDPFLNTKYYNNLPPFLKEPIDILHEADLAAH